MKHSFWDAKASGVDMETGARLASSTTASHKGMMICRHIKYAQIPVIRTEKPIHEFCNILLPHSRSSSASSCPQNVPEAYAARNCVTKCLAVTRYVKRYFGHRLYNMWPQSRRTGRSARPRFQRGYLGYAHVRPRSDTWGFGVQACERLTKTWRWSG